MIITTPVLLNDDDARKFVLFQKYYDVFKKLEETDAFGIQFGKVTMNIAYGNIQNVIKEEVIYHIKDK